MTVTRRSKLGLLLEALFDEARRGHPASRLLFGGLRVTASWRGDQRYLWLERPGNLKGPSVQEAKTCAKHASFPPNHGLLERPEEGRILVYERYEP